MNTNSFYGSTTSRNLCNYNKIKEDYNKTLETLFGSGDRCNSIIEKLYQKLLSAYELLSEEEKSKVSLPRREINSNYYNDGNDGYITGITMQSLAIERYFGDSKDICSLQ